MKISSIEVYQDSKPFEIHFHSGQAYRTRSASVIVRFGFDNGFSSFGESAPRQYVTGETLSSVDGLIRNDFSPLLLHREIACLQDIESILKELEDFCLKNRSGPYLSALGAIDIALLDGLGKFENKPISKYLGEPVFSSSNRYSISIPFLPAELIQQLFPHFQKYSCKHFKVLVGQEQTWNIDRLTFLRSLLGDEVELRVEVNGKWNLDQALAHIQALETFGISALEQPLPAHDVDGLRRFKDQTEIPVVVDESLCSLSDAKRLIDTGACDIMNIKISKCGGLLRSRSIAELALSARIPCQLGAHVGETEILESAGEHFSTTRELLWIDGKFSFLLFGNEGSDEYKNRLAGPGLGIHHS